MTKEEYLASTNIKSAEEARQYLKNLNMLFWAVFISSYLVRASTEFFTPQIHLILFLAYIGLLIYFLVYCVKVLRAEKINAGHAVWSFLFAPISWLYFYPKITNPLKMITGQKAVISTEEQAQQAKRANRNVFKTIGIAFGVAILVTIGAVLFIEFNR